MTRDELNAALRQTQVDIIIASRRYDAAKTLYDSACFVGDGVTAATYRAELHDALDALLDISATAMSLTRQLLLSSAS